MKLQLITMAKGHLHRSQSHCARAQKCLSKMEDILAIATKRQHILHI